MLIDIIMLIAGLIIGIIAGLIIQKKKVEAENRRLNKQAEDLVSRAKS